MEKLKTKRHFDQVFKLAQKVHLNNKEFFSIFYEDDELRTKHEAEGDIVINDKLKMKRIDNSIYLIDINSECRYIVLKDNEGDIEKLEEEIKNLLKDEIEKVLNVKVKDIVKEGKSYVFRFEIEKEAIRGETEIKVPVAGNTFYYSIDVNRESASISEFFFNELFMWKIVEKYRRAYADVYIKGNFAYLENWIEVS